LSEVPKDVESLEGRVEVKGWLVNAEHRLQLAGD